jgi:pimeloyl-ACP methyl ester carboxylesterase
VAGGKWSPDSSINADRPIATLWPQFEALTRVPVMVIRGANSDILSSDTVDAMKARHPAMEVLVVPDQGHAPLLVEPAIIADIQQFAEKCDAAQAAAA